ncbi:MAG: hypothetical protein G3M70_01415 [Candidatus Nitronauta litoralis]|uniref:N-acetyltransferase ESCO zinc-finger domain-containing protein n=1 Tax=Candidatus Nitronauta litoralis TaxID=2705533 RepID=A0A7T0BTB3_9BACT|nr:MAG: hypothetical protein G3M70_01415 [Candidatus Nitronauta litoralis]
MRCADCGLGFSKNSSEDKIFHQKYHDEVINGLHWETPLKENIFYSRTNFRIVFVSKNAPLFLQERTKRVSSMGNLETEFDGGVYDMRVNDMAALLGILNGRAVSIIVLIRMESYWRGKWENIPVSKFPTEKFSDMKRPWGIHFFWIHKKYRGTKILLEMPKAACSISGFSKIELPLRAPFSDEFEHFWKKYSPDGLTLGLPYLRDQKH